MSGHILLPRPNGMNSKLDTLKSIREPWNLSGRKQSASIQYSICNTPHNFIWGYNNIVI